MVASNNRQVANTNGTAPTVQAALAATKAYEVLADLDEMPMGKRAFKAEGHPEELKLLKSMVPGKVKAVKLNDSSKRSFKTIMNGLAKANKVVLIWKDGADGVVYFRLQTEADKAKPKRTRKAKATANA